MFLKKCLKFIPLILVFITILYFIHTNYEMNRNLLTFEESYKMAEKIASKWNENSLLYSAVSVDLEQDNNYKYEKRAGWNFEFSVNDSNEHCIIEIENGQVSSTNYIKDVYVTEDNLIIKKEIKATFREVLKKSIKDFSLNPGENWAIGYHCEIYKDNNVPLIVVIGLNPEKMQQKIFYNLNTGKFLKEIHKEPVGGGLYINSKKIDLFEDNKWGVIGVNSTHKGYLAWGYQIIDYISSKPFMIERDGDNSREIKTDEMVVYSWLNEKNGNNKIFALTENNLMYTSDYGLNWIDLIQHDFNLIDYFIKDKDDVYILSSTELFHIQDEGKSIETIPTLKNTTRNGKDKDGILHAIIDGKLYYFDHNEWKKEGNYSELKSLDILDDYLIIAKKVTLILHILIRLLIMNSDALYAIT